MSDEVVIADDLPEIVTIGIDDSAFDAALPPAGNFQKATRENAEERAVGMI